MCKLNDVPIGTKCVVKSINNDISIKRRFYDLGLIPNVEIEVLFKSPLGDPTAYLIKGSIIAIRKEDAKKVEVELI